MKQLACGERRRGCVFMTAHSAQPKLKELWLSTRTASLTDSCWEPRLCQSWRSNRHGQIQAFWSCAVSERGEGGAGEGKRRWG